MGRLWLALAGGMLACGSPAPDIDLDARADGDGGGTDSGGPAPAAVHLRSIGGATGVLYASGSVSAMAGEVAVEIAGGEVPETIGSGDVLMVAPGTADELELFIESRQSATSLTLQVPPDRNLDALPYGIRRAYPSITAWYDARSGNVVAEGRREIGVCYDDGVFEENIILSGSVTDAEHYLHLTAGESARHTGLAGTGIIIDPIEAGHGIFVGDDYTRLEWLEVTDWSANAGGSYDGISIAANDVLVQYVIVHDDGHGGVTNSDAGGIQLVRDLASATVRNSLVYHVARIGVGIHGASDSELVVENVTVYGCVEADTNTDYGCITVRDDRNVLHARNVIAMASAGLADFRVGKLSNGSFGSSSNNISSDDSAPGPQSLINVLPASEFVSIASGAVDLHLSATAQAIDRGMTLEASSSDDIDRQTRIDAWDIGADER